MIDLHSRSVADTHGIAGAIASIVRPRDVIVLAGEMGAGKTAFTVGFTRALGVSEDDQVSSPTFTLVHSYNSGRIPVLHADLYRLNSLGEVADLGLREQVNLGAVALIEWGDVAAEVIGESLTIELLHDEDDDDVRNIMISVEGHGWDSRWDKLRESLRQWSAQ